jgi:hypothetical protein
VKAIAAVAVLATAALAAGGASAARFAPRVPFDSRSISQSQCTPPGSGAKQVVDVTFGLRNYADSGYASQWAIDTVKRHLRIWRHADGTYCAQIVDDGSTFVTRAGPSPTGMAFIPSGIRGTFKGGYVTLSIVGTFEPHYGTHGNLGTFDARCDVQFECPGAHPTWLSYFVHPNAQQFAHWGWLYDAGDNGSWLDQENVTPPFGGDIRG